jgi:hypothetical protein
VGDTGATRRAAGDEGALGLLSIVISLVIVALLSVGALKTFASGTGAGPGSPPLKASVDQAYDVQAQSALSNALQNVRDGAISTGGLSGSDLAQYGVTTGPSVSPSDVSGVVAGAGAADGANGPLGPGSVTLAAQSKSGTCWFVWFSTSVTWYGFEPDATSCAAEVMVGAPSASRGSPGTIGWQEGSFPIVG